VARVEELARSPRPGAPAVSAPAVEAIAEAVVASSWPAGDRPGAEQRAEELVVLLGAVVVAAHGILPDTDTLELVLRRTVGRPAATPVPLPTAAAAPAVTSVHPVSGSATPDLGVPASDTPLVLPGLPFLVLVQLARLGYLEPALATLVACDAPPAALVAAVAGACLDPPGRGRRRESFDRTAVGMAAGLEEDEIDDVLGRLAAEEQAVEPGWRSALIELYVAGRSRDDELVVTELGAERLCGEAPGLLPIAWVPAEQLDEVLDQLGRPVVRVDPLLAPLAEELAPRRALPGLVAPALERQVATVVGSALGSLAVELWGGDADALTALDRLGDLEVQVTQGERLRIGIPRGQRWLDLQRAGLLEPWWVPGAAGSPWEVGTW
jgi:hypothetical protein